MSTINTMFNRTYSNVKDLIKKGSKVTIKTDTSTIVLTLVGHKVVTEVYEAGSLSKVAYHAISSIKELYAVFEELGLCLYKIARELLINNMFKKSKPLLLDYRSKGDS